MIQKKTFKSDDDQGFNDFVKEHSPRGEQGIKFNSDNFFVFFEDGDQFTKSDKIQKLRFDLGKGLENEFEYEKQMIKARVIRDSFDPMDPKFKDSWKQTNAQYMQTRKMLELEIFTTKAVLEMLKKLGVDVNVEHAELPVIEKDPTEPNIISPIQKEDIGEDTK